MKPIQPTHNLLGSKLLSALGPKLYHNPRYALRELIQNAYDAINQLNRFMSEKEIDATESRRIEVFVESDTLHVLDKGIGMDINEIWEYCSLGLNKKVRRLDAGAHGVGTYAGAAIGHNLEVRTKKYGEKIGYKAVIDFDVIFENESKKGTSDYIHYAEDLTKKAVTVYQDETDYLEAVHFTHVKIRLNKEAKVLFADLEDISNFLSLYCPVDFSPKTDSTIVAHIKNNMQQAISIQNPIKIVLNNTPVYKQNIENVRLLENDLPGVDVREIKIGEKVVAQVWFGLNKKLESIKNPLTKGMVFYLDGFMVDSIDRTSVAQYFNRNDIAYYYTGEVHLLEESIEPDLERTWIQPTVFWREMETKIKKFIKPLESKVQSRSQVENATKSLKELLDVAKTLIHSNEQTLSSNPWQLTELKAKLDEWKKSVKKHYGPKKRTKYSVELQTRCDSALRKCDEILKSIEIAKNSSKEKTEETSINTNVTVQSRSPFDIFNQSESKLENQFAINNETTPQSSQPITMQNENSSDVEQKKYSVLVNQNENSHIQSDAIVPNISISTQCDERQQTDTVIIDISSNDTSSDTNQILNEPPTESLNILISKELLFSIVSDLIMDVRKRPQDSTELFLSRFEEKLKEEL